MTDHALNVLPSRHARTQLPAVTHERLRHLSLRLGVPLHQLLAEGALLLLRYHGDGEGLPEPTAPVVDKSNGVSR
ncbi:MAG: hypothetical protein ACHREM_31765 [Polyangiales bacterium]